MKKSDLLNKIVDRILAIRRKDVITVVGIDGKGCSGKSTIANSIYKAIKNQQVPCNSISIDDFCNARTIRYAEDVPVGLQVYVNNFDEDVFDELIKTAHISQALNLELMTLNVLSDKLSNKIVININSGGILLVEGIHLFKKRRQSFFDLKILITIDDDEQLKRALVRDPGRGVKPDSIVQKYQERFIPSYLHYLKIDDPHSIADIIVSNNDPTNPVFIKI